MAGPFSPHCTVLHYSEGLTRILRAARPRVRRLIVQSNCLGLIRSLGVMGVLLLLASCAESHGQPTQQTAPAAPASPTGGQDSQYEALATIRDLMDYMVDPTADALWNSVAVVSTKSGVDRRQPRTNKDWKAVRDRAVMLIESTNLLIMGTRRAAPAGTVPGEGELTVGDIDQLLVTQRAAFVGFALNLRVASQRALTAIDQKNAAELFRSGGDIDEACEACHIVFWYPEQRIPRN
jgi:hypothetical protein